MHARFRASDWVLALFPACYVAAGLLAVNCLTLMAQYVASPISKQFSVSRAVATRACSPYPMNDGSRYPLHPWPHNLPATLTRVYVLQKRLLEGDPVDKGVKSLCKKLRENTSTTGPLQGRVLNLKRKFPRLLNGKEFNKLMVALGANWRVEVVYMQGLVKRLSSQQVQQLIELLRLGRIWSLNMGEIELACEDAVKLARQLKNTNLAYVYVSEHLLKGFEDRGYTFRGAHVSLVAQFQHEATWNRTRSPARDDNVRRHVVLSFCSPEADGSKVDLGDEPELLEGIRIEPLGARVASISKESCCDRRERL